MGVVGAGLRVSEVVALKVNADAISRYVQFFQTRLAPLPRYRDSAERVATIEQRAALIQRGSHRK
jgi:hypothetical protein